MLFFIILNILGRTNNYMLNVFIKKRLLQTS